MTDVPTPRPVTGAASPDDGPEARLRALIAQQEAFSYGVSHDLRGPLRMIEHAADGALRALEAGRGEAADSTASSHASVSARAWRNCACVRAIIIRPGTGGTLSDVGVGHGRRNHRHLSRVSSP